MVYRRFKKENSRIFTYNQKKNGNVYAFVCINTTLIRFYGLNNIVSQRNKRY